MLLNISYLFKNSIFRHARVSSTYPCMSVRPSVGWWYFRIFPICQRLWSPYVKSWRDRTPIIFVYFPKVYFSKVYFPKVYFRKVYFLKVYFRKVYFKPSVPGQVRVFRAFASLFRKQTLWFKRYDLNIAEHWHTLKVKVAKKNQFLTISMLAKLSENICESMFSDIDFTCLLLGGVC